MFLVIAFFSGIGIKLYKSSIGNQTQYNYSAIDSEFIARSAVPESLLSKNAADGNLASDSLVNINSSLKNLEIKSIDINSASKNELMKLPGIGETIAQNIISYREKNGNFKNISGLMKVGGIGKKKFEKISPLVTAGK
ncbi:MAG: helix-hairpin-helix domain-containing protein [Ignavibacteriales bacterium]|nr:helix-hairpin-helix domain-containing protein [Ignavibacteriales bacterium]